MFPSRLGEDSGEEEARPLRPESNALGNDAISEVNRPTTLWKCAEELTALVFLIPPALDPGDSGFPPGELEFLFLVLYMAIEIEFAGVLACGSGGPEGLRSPFRECRHLFTTSGVPTPGKPLT